MSTEYLGEIRESPVGSDSASMVIKRKWRPRKMKPNTMAPSSISPPRQQKSIDYLGERRKVR